MTKKKWWLSKTPDRSPKFLHNLAVQEIMKRLPNRDRNIASLVHKDWYKADTDSRVEVYSNGYAISPEKVIKRFPLFKALNLKGSPVGIKSEEEWGCSVTPWIQAMSNNATTSRVLEKLRLVRMDVTDSDLYSISITFPNFKSLTLESCRGFTINGGLSAIASNRRNLEELVVQDCDIEDYNGGEWLTRFADSLVTLDIMTIRGSVALSYLEPLLRRSSNLRTFTVNESLAGTESIRRILTLAPSNLQHLGVGSDRDTLLDTSILLLDIRGIHRLKNMNAFTFSGPTIRFQSYLSVLNHFYRKFTLLNLRNRSGAFTRDERKFIAKCSNLRSLWLSSEIGSVGLHMISTCKHLTDLRIFREDGSLLKETGLDAISEGCPQLENLEYHCFQMTDDVLIKLSKNCQKLKSFKLFVQSIPKDMHLVEGIKNILVRCNHLRKLTLSGPFLCVFLLLGTLGGNLKKLSIKTIGSEDWAEEEIMKNVLDGCKKLCKLKIRRCSLLQAAQAFSSKQLKTLVMTDCDLQVEDCKQMKTSTIGIKILKENMGMVQSLCMYRVVG